MTNKKSNLSRTSEIINGLIKSGQEWNIKYRDDISSMGLLNFYYVVDEPTGWIWTFCSPRASSEVKSMVDSFRNKTSLEEIRGGLGSLICQCAINQAPETVNGFDWEDQLSLLCLTYATTTKTFEMCNKMQDGGHFIIINYRKNDIDAKESYLRPFALGDKTNTLLPLDELKNCIERVKHMDKEKHPEWLA